MLSQVWRKSSRGLHQFISQRIGSVNLKGIVHFTSCFVSNRSYVTGRLQADFSEIHSANVIGGVLLSNTKIINELKSTGETRIVNCRVNQLSTQSPSMEIEDSTVNQLIVEQSENRKQVIHLMGATTIRGLIRFEGDNVELILGPKVKIEGEISGHVVVRRLDDVNECAVVTV